MTLNIRIGAMGFLKPKESCSDIHLKIVRMA